MRERLDPLLRMYISLLAPRNNSKKMKKNQKSRKKMKKKKSLKKN
jgi:hypothetical protein